MTPCKSKWKKRRLITYNDIFDCADNNNDDNNNNSNNNNENDNHNNYLNYRLLFLIFPFLSW